MLCRRKPPRPCVDGLRTGLFIEWVASRAPQVRRLFSGSAAPPLLGRGGLLTQPEGGSGSFAAPVMASAVSRPAVERPASHSRRDAVVEQFLSLADALARRFQRRFAGLIELDDARQVARYELIRASACVKPGCCTTAVFLKQRIQGALQHYLRDHGRLVRVSRREHEKGIDLWGHQSLDALGADERPYLDKLAAPESEEPASEGHGVSAEALLQRLPANEAAILRLRVLESRSLRSIAAVLGVSTMIVNRHEKAALAALREQLD
jgi:RNA polymerase sigma factor (sigma-70 family)